MIKIAIESGDGLAANFLWRDRTPEVDFLIDIAGTLELFDETELPTGRNTLNLELVLRTVGASCVLGGAVASRPATVFRWLMIF